nr:ABC transporter permease [Dactylosporangium thailandense]
MTDLTLPESPADTPTGRRRRRRRLSIAGAAAVTIIALVAAAAVLAPWLTPYSPTAGDITKRLLPLGSPGHLFGTDGQGRDILTRLLFGGRLSLLAGVVPVAVAGVLGLVLGVVAGQAGPHVNAVIMRALDVFYAFPAVLLAIAIAAALGPGIANAVIALAVVLVPSVARVTETEVKRLRSADFMEAARASGASRVRIAVVHVLPNVLPAVLVYCTALVGLSIVFAAGLSFLGLGVAPPVAEWGAMVSELQSLLFVQPALLLVPALAILIVSIAFNVLGDALRELLDVRGAVR